MKKILICLFGAILLTNCEIKVKETKAQTPNQNTSYHLCYTGHFTEVVYSYKTYRNMDYVVISQREGGVTIINLTKDELEVELLKKQLGKK